MASLDLSKEKIALEREKMDNELKIAVLNFLSKTQQGHVTDAMPHGATPTRFEQIFKHVKSIKEKPKSWLPRFKNPPPPP